MTQQVQRGTAHTAMSGAWIAEGVCALLSLPEECLIRVYQFLGDRDVHALEACCKDLRRIGQSHQIWSPRVEQRLGVPVQARADKTSSVLVQFWTIRTSSSVCRRQIASAVGSVTSCTARRSLSLRGSPGCTQMGVSTRSPRNTWWTPHSRPASGLATVVRRATTSTAVLCCW